MSECRRSFPVLLAVGSVALLCGIARNAGAQFNALYEHDAIQYSNSEPANAVSRLNDRIVSGDVELAHDETFGWLPSLLRALEIDPASQGLVFSKTSLQRRAISPSSPRAIYFNDTTYVGYPNGGDLIEISVADPELGAVFYSVDQRNSKRLTLKRETDTCLACHGSSAHTDGVPGHMMRSVFTDANGFPELSLGSFRIRPNTPIEERWGGWYVTGKTGDNPHLGNQWVNDKDAPERYEPACETIARWPEQVHNADYLAETSDIAGLLVLEHQITVHNAITQARFSTQRALWDERVLDETLDDGDPATLRESTRGRIDRAAKKLAETLLCLREAPLGEGIEPDPAFAKQFSARARRDEQGRALRDFGLETRLFRYPCSFLIHSEDFRKLPDPLKSSVVRQITTWLEQGIPDDSGEMAVEDCKAILEILRATHPEFADSGDHNSTTSAGKAPGEKVAKK